MEKEVQTVIDLLVKRRDLLRAIISKLEIISGSSVSSGKASLRKRPGRKSVSDEERQRISEQKKAWWAERRAKKSRHAAGALND